MGDYEDVGTGGRPLGFDTPSVFCFAKSTSPATQGHSGWNKVALLTAVRNSPCSCPFSVSLTRPQDALNSEPQGGRLNMGSLHTAPKGSPLRGVFGRYTQTLVQSRRAANDGPCSASYKLSAIIKGRLPSPYFYILSQPTPPAPYSALHSGSVRLGRTQAARSARRRLSLPRCPCRSACPAGRSAGSRGAPPFQARCGGQCSH